MTYRLFTLFHQYLLTLGNIWSQCTFSIRKLLPYYFLCLYLSCFRQHCLKRLYKFCASGMLPKSNQKIPFTNNFLDDFEFLTNDNCCFFNPVKELLVVLPGPSSKSPESLKIISQASTDIDVCYVNPRNDIEINRNRKVIYATADGNVLKRLLGMNNVGKQYYNIYHTVDTTLKTDQVLYLDCSPVDDSSFYKTILNDAPNNVFAAQMPHKSTAKRLQLGSGLCVLIYLLSIGVTNITVLGFDEYLPKINKSFLKTKEYELLQMLVKSQFPHRRLTAILAEQLLVVIYLFRIQSNSIFKVSVNGRINNLMKLLHYDQTSLFNLLYNNFTDVQ